MRSKENAQDYRYFPDPDLLPLVITEKMIGDARKSMPESLESKRLRFVQAGIPAHTAETLTASLSNKTRIVEKAQSIIEALVPPEKRSEILRNTANTVVSSASPALDSWGETSVSNVDLPREIVLLHVRAYDGQISSRQAKEVLDEVLAGNGTSDEVINKKGLIQISDAGEIERVVDTVLAANAKQVEDYRAGKDKAFNSLVGQVMKATQGKANPAQVNVILRRKLSSG
jgi:aspartyl-tRNA(Asn)/glutamyl-tRNA(Gln) amidotransferase subunit B